MADVIPSIQDEVWGLVYEITNEDLEALDRYEGYPDVYTRFEGSVNTAAVTLSNVVVYSVVQKRAFVPPTERYLGIIRKAAHEFEFPKSYQDYLGHIETVNSN